MASAKRKQSFDHFKSDRSLRLGDKVLVCVPGLHGALEASWERPYVVEKVVSRVTYIVKRVGGGSTRLVHLNNTKVYKDRPVSVSSVCIMAEESEVMEAVMRRPQDLCSEPCEGFVLSELEAVLDEYSDCFGEKPGLCTVVTCRIEVVPGSDIVSSPPHSIPQAMREAVNEEIQKLFEGDIIKASESPWYSPIVPVRKQDGSMRVCVDYRRLNQIIPPNRF